MDWKTHRKQLLKNPQVKKAWGESRLEFEIAKSVIETRIKRGLTQKQLARKMSTGQSAISRLENAKTTPSLSLLKKLATALNASLQVNLKI